MSTPSPVSSPATDTSSPPATVSNGTASPPPLTNKTAPLIPSSPGNFTQPPLPLSPPSSPLPPATPVAPTTSSDGGMPKGTLVGLIMGTALGGMLMLILVGIVVFIYKRGKKRRMRKYGPEYFSSGGGPVNPKEDRPGAPPQHWQHSVPQSTSAYGQVTLSEKPSTPQGLALSRQPLPVYNHAPPQGNSTSSNLASDRPATSPGIAFGLSQSTFTYEELAMATDSFSSSNLLGQGGFGYVHKGVLSNGKEVAIKQLKSGSGQGEREFQAEVEVIGRVHHRHLVSLVGYCISGERRLLVYEFVPNNNLEFHLHEHDRPPMDWQTRMKIALGSARGLAYLHEDCQPKIIHRDIKAANILLDHSFEAKVADFGLAKISLDTDTHVSTRVMGTFGYLAPEYAASGKLTEKSDVFSFGVVLLELITGHRPIDKTQSFTDDSMVDWARPLLSQALDTGNFDALADQRLGKNYDSDEMLRMIACAATCVRHSARRRPQMSQVVRALEGIISLDDLNKGSAPGHSAAFSSFDSTSYETNQYNEDLKKFRKLVLESQDQGASEYSGPSSDYGMHPSASSSDQQTTQEMELKK